MNFLLFPYLLSLVAKYQLVDAAVVALAVYLATSSYHQPDMLVNQKINIITTLVLLPLATYSLPTSVSSHLYLLATGCLPVLTAYPLGHSLLLIANLWRVYLLTINIGHLNLLAALQCLCHFVLIGCTLNVHTYQTELKQLWSFITCQQEFNLHMQQWYQNITLADMLLLHPLMQVDQPVSFDLKQKYCVTKAILNAVWKPLLWMQSIKLAVDMLHVWSISLYGQLLQSFDMSDHITSHFMCILLSWAASNIASGIDVKISESIDIFWIEVTDKAIIGLRKCIHVGRRASYSEKVMAENYLKRLIRYIKGIVKTFNKLINSAIATWMLYRQVHFLAVIPFVVKIGMNLLVYYFHHYDSKGRTNGFNESYMSFDLMVDIYEHIRAIKYHGWESTFMRLLQPRSFSKKSQLYNMCCKLIQTAISSVQYIRSQICTLLIARLHYGKTNSNLSSAMPYQMLQLDKVVSRAYNSIGDMLESSTSINKIFITDQLIREFLCGSSSNTLPQKYLPDLNSEAKVILDNCSFTPNEKSENAVVENITLSVTGSDIVAVTGPSGSGKSSLLLSICGEAKMLSGTGYTQGQVAYLEQPPWIMNDTIRANILFGRKFNMQHYQQALFACALADDIAQWPDGDLTLIGENGINISGGQRARLALARALYAPADIYVLDDPLSAVDAHVKRHIMEHVILDTGILGGKLRIIGANTNHIVPFASQIVTMDNGCATVAHQAPQTYTPVLGPMVTTPIELADEAQIQQKLATSNAVVSSDVMAKTKENAPRPPKWTVWKNALYLINTCGWPSVLAIVMLGLVHPIAQFVVDKYILVAMKTHGQFANSSIHTVLSLFYLNFAQQMVQSTLQPALDYCSAGLKYKLIQHNIEMAFIDGVMHAPLSYFDDTSSSHLVSEFNKGAIRLASQFADMVFSKPAAVVGTLLSLYHTMESSPYLLAIALPIVCIDLAVTGVNASLTAQLEKLFRVMNSQMFKLMSISRNSGPLARIYNVEGYFAQITSQAMIDTHMLTGLKKLCRSIIKTYLQISDTVSFIVHSLAVKCYSQLKGTSISSAELCHHRMVYHMLYGYLNELLLLSRQLHELSCLADINRQYNNIEPEAPYVIEGNRPAVSWPQQGKIEISHLYLKYRDNLNYALKDINLVIYPKEKIGIVGRTGAGKSSLAKALFRLVPAGISGSIKIDGQEITELGVGDVRPRLGIIPQEPTIFPGTFRQNLDPGDNSTLENIWAALIKCQMASVVAPQDSKSKQKRKIVPTDIREWQRHGILMKLWLIVAGKAPKPRAGKEDEWIAPLDTNASSHNYNLSSGQQQLFSLCRLVMRQHKVVVLDEATANVDLETDGSVQKVIQKEFADSTVLTIAHRLETIMGSDRIIVMDQGKIAEIGPPAELLQQGGYFAELVRANDFGQYSSEQVE